MGKRTTHPLNRAQECSAEHHLMPSFCHKSFLNVFLLLSASFEGKTEVKNAGRPVPSVLDLSDDELFPRRLDHFFCHHAYLINLKNAFNLGTQAMNETEISSGNPNDGRNGLHIAKIVWL